MNWRPNYYRLRGYAGYVHGACLTPFKQANGRYGAQGWLVWEPEIIAMIFDIGAAGSRPCLHCKGPLGEPAK